MPCIDSRNNSTQSVLTFHDKLFYKKTMQLAHEIKNSLKREYNLCSNAVTFYKNALKQFELKYHFSTKTFLKRFESGLMGDNTDYFDWFAYARLLEDWQKTLSAIRSAVE